MFCAVDYGATMRNGDKIDMRCSQDTEYLEWYFSTGEPHMRTASDSFLLILGPFPWIACVEDCQ